MAALRWMVPFRRRLWRIYGRALAILAFGLLLAAALWALVLIPEQAERDSVITAAVQQANAQAEAHEQQVGAVLKRVDELLLKLRAAYRGSGAVPNLKAHASTGLAGERAGMVAVSDDRGMIIVGRVPDGGRSVEGRDYFEQPRKQQGDRLHVGAPVAETGAMLRRVPVSRSWQRPDGSFGGVMVYFVEQGLLIRIERGVEVGALGLMSLVGMDGVTRAARLGYALDSRGDYTGPRLLSEHAQRSTGAYVDSATDGVDRHVSYRAVAGHPLVVAHAVARSEILERHLRSRNLSYLGAAIGTAMILMFSMMLVVAAMRQERAEIALATSEARFRATFEQAAIGIAHSSLDRRYIAVNPKFCEMLGYSRDELVGRPSIDLTHPDDRDDETVLEPLRTGRVESITAEKRYMRKDGSIIWGNRTLSLVRDHTGEPLYFLRVVEDITARKRLEDELREMATTDALTGLTNRRAFMTRLEEEHARMRRFDNQPVSVLMMDLDFFKRINDTRGHAAGDEVLRQVAAVMRDATRRVDLCSRLGGEEFAILLAGAAPEAACEFAERLRIRIADTRIVHEDVVVPVTVSIGVAALQASDETADQSLSRADRALYEAKAQGRNRVVVAGESAPAAA